MLTPWSYDYYDWEIVCQSDPIKVKSGKISASGRPSALVSACFLFEVFCAYYQRKKPQKLSSKIQLHITESRLSRYYPSQVFSKRKTILNGSVSLQFGIDLCNLTLDRVLLMH